MKASHALVLAAVPCFLVMLLNCSDQVNDAFPKVPGNVDGGDAGPVNAKPAQPHENRNPQPKVTECKTLPASDSVCTVTRTSTSGNRVVQGTILGNEETFHGGEVVINSKGIIVCTGCDCSTAPEYADASVITCANGVVSPGLINPHEHLTYQNNKPVGHGEIRYENRNDWGGGLRGYKRLSYDSGASLVVQAYGEMRFLMGGATTIAGAGGVPGFLRNLDTSADELDGAPTGVGSSDTFPLGLPRMNIATGCEYAQRTTSATATSVEAYIPHVSEGIDTESRNEFVCISKDDNYNLIKPNTGIIHAVAINAADAALIQQNRSKVIWSPRSNVDLYGNTAQAVMLDLAGVVISLGTDWIPSGSMNELRELKCADEWNQTRFDKHFTDADLWRMATVNGAYATSTASILGMLRPGYLGDLAVFDGSTSKDHRAVIDAGVEDVALVLRGGKALYGDTAILASGAFDTTGCEPYAGGVCGREKTVCVDVNISAAHALTDIRTAGEKFYPAFFCKDKTPDNEPSCFPFRPASINGSTIYDGKPTDLDTDGDGIVDSRDNCPTIFNPVRPVDNGTQADADNDGIGDACDECPASDTQDCGHATSGDMDSDGTPNGLDNCPEQANPDQADADGDGRGDACDACPSAPNPGAVPCPLPIHVVRNPDEAGHPATKSIVAVDGYVTAKVSNKYLWVQEGLTGAPWEGIYVPAGGLAGTASTGPQVGQKVTVTGLASESFGVNQISAAVVNITDTTKQKLVPLQVNASQVNTAAGKDAEPFESLLVTVGTGNAGSLTVTNENPDSPSQFFAFVTTGNLWVDDYIWSYYGTSSPTGTACGVKPPAVPPSPQCDYPRVGLTNGATFPRLTGIMGWSFSQRRLYPRGASTTATGPCQTGSTCPDIVLGP